MSAPAFTPGPWQAVRYETGQKALTVEASGLPLLKMYAGRNEEANASLIAAAPELYEALEKCRAVLLPNADRAIAEQVDAALAKARGEQ